MLKRISVQHLSLGMYLHQFCGSWMDHPFWRTGFVLQDPADLARIHGTAIEEVWIDVSKGRDVDAGVQTVSPEQAEARRETDFQNLQEMPALKVAAAPPAPAAAPARRNTAPTSMAEELAHAAALTNHARQTMTSMFTEARMGRVVDSSEARSLVEEISDSVTRNPSALISLARLKTADDYTYMHSVAVCALMVALGRQVGLEGDRLRVAGMAGLMHDIGKARIPLSVLNKPGKLTDDEFDVIRSHSEHGHRMLLACGGVDDEVLDACLHHHEKMDGTGYPHKLAGEDIGLIARMTAICDVYDAITSDRPYKRGWDPAESLRRMAEWTHGHFDARLFQGFVKSIGIYPVGSLVRLASGRIGVVMEQSASLVSPRVKVFFSTRSDLRIPPEVIDLSQPGSGDKIVAREDPDKWRFPDLVELWAKPGSAGR
ncbi:HD-GYP domain-containing protein [Paracidovorax konjaci]|uniref:HDIG domain-containing protein n=1 Tax=Paracidovorax konjaci TaxID=32040 RepID=A0A1I1V6G7_9BURK|nr:HD-GYP domain-containing protein [Paracidovorax konjaci]SFD78631.1 HDIG domain-containing protein [Paracidovorax konjaci]